MFQQFVVGILSNMQFLAHSLFISRSCSLPLSWLSFHEYMNVRIAALTDSLVLSAVGLLPASVVALTLNCCLVPLPRLSWLPKLHQLSCWAACDTEKERETEWERERACGRLFLGIDYNECL